MSVIPIKNMGHSVGVRLKNLARTQKINLDYLYLRYAFERFLYRLSVSPYSERFILKGAAAFSVWISPIFRMTRDTDLACSGDPDPVLLANCFKDICALPGIPDDGVRFDMNSLVTSEIKKEVTYKGIRVVFNAYLVQVRVSLQFDIGFGDAISPEPEYHDYPVLLDGAIPKLKIYPQYSVISEKFEAIVVLGMLNSRLKDYFDIWLLTENFDFDYIMLKTAIQKTFHRRGIALPTRPPAGLTSAFSDDPVKQSQWNGFLKRVSPPCSPDSLTSATKRISSFLSPVLSTSGEHPSLWKASQGWV